METATAPTSRRPVKRRRKRSTGPGNRPAAGRPRQPRCPLRGVRCRGAAAFRGLRRAALRRTDEDRPTLDALAERFGLTRDQVRYAMEQVRKRSERLLRQEVRDQVGADVDLEEEIRKLAAIGDRGGR